MLQAEVKQKCKQLQAVKGELDMRHAQVDDYKLSIKQMQVNKWLASHQTSLHKDTFSCFCTARSDGGHLSPTCHNESVGESCVQWPTQVLSNYCFRWTRFSIAVHAYACVKDSFTCLWVSLKVVNCYAVPLFANWKGWKIASKGQYCSEAILAFLQDMQLSGEFDYKIFQ